MKSLGFYIDSSVQNVKFVEKIISTTISSANVKVYSNTFMENVELFKEEPHFYANIYNEVNTQIDELSKAFYKKYTNTPLCNQNFNFWVHLRFNSLKTLLNFNKIKAWMNEMILQKNIEAFHFVGIDSKTQNLIKFHFKNVSFHNVNIDSKKDNNSKKLLFNFFKIILVGIKSSFKRINLSNKSLFISRKISFSKIQTKNGLVKEDKYIYNIISELNSDKYERILDTNLLSKKNLLNYSIDDINNGFKLNSERILVRALFKPSFYFKIIETYTFLKKTLKSENTFLTTLLKNNKAGVFTELIIFWMYYYFFKKNNLKNIILNDEMSPGSNSLVSAAKQFNINTIGIQHGIINKNNLTYNFTDFELANNNPFPNKLIVWGRDEDFFFQKNSQFLKDVITPLGNVLFDGCKYLIPKKDNKFTVLFATQPQPIEAQRLNSISDFVDAVREFEPSEIKVIVRLHPREVNDYSIYNIYFEKLASYDFVIDKGNEIFSQLNEIDVLVTSFSTIAKDAMVLKKPIVLMDYYGKDNTGLISKGVAFNSVTSNELYNLLLKLKNNDLVVDSKIYNKALAETFVDTDFEVSKKIIDLL